MEEQISQLICRKCGCENAENIFSSNLQKFGNVETIICDTTEGFFSQIHKGDTLLQQICKKCLEESNTAFLLEKRLKETDPKFKISDAQLDRATDDLSLGDAQIKIENEFLQNEIELKQEGEKYFANSDSEYGVASLKVEEVKVELCLPELYSCKECNRNYNGFASYITHCETKHGNLCENGWYTQNITDEEKLKCKAEFNEPGTSTGSPSRKTKSFAISKPLKKCTSVDVNLKKVKFDIGDGGYTKGSLKKHMITHTVEKPFKCDVCDSAFVWKSLLQRHVMTHTREKPFKCDVCNSGFLRKSNLARHLMIHTERKKFKCDLCDSGFVQISHLNRHVMTHTGEKRFKCDFCESRFVQKSHLLHHAMMHTGEKPFKCDVCERGFVRKSHLNYHLMTHTGEKPFKCNFCNNRFLRKSDLARHMMIHTGRKKFKCDLCDRGFIEKSHLKYHMMTHTGDKPFKCNLCTSGFLRKSDLSRHEATHTGEKSFKCNLCDSGFFQKSHLKQHVMTHIGKNHLTVMYVIADSNKSHI